MKTHYATIFNVSRQLICNKKQNFVLNSTLRNTLRIGNLGLNPYFVSLTIFRYRKISRNIRHSIGH